MYYSEGDSLSIIPVATTTTVQLICLVSHQPDGQQGLWGLKMGQCQ